MESFKICTFLPYDCWVQLSRVDINLIISRRYCKLAYQCQSHHKRSLFFMFSLNKRNFNAWHEILFCWCTQQFLSHYYVVTKSPCLPFIVLDLSKASIVYLPRSRARWRSRVSAFIHFYERCQVLRFTTCWLASNSFTSFLVNQNTNLFWVARARLSALSASYMDLPCSFDTLHRLRLAKTITVPY